MNEQNMAGLSIMKRETRFVYLCGAGLSGSTLLSLVMDGHPQISSLGEIVHFCRYLDTDPLCTCGKRLSNCQFWQRVLAEMDRSAPEWRACFRIHGLLPQGPTNPVVKRWIQTLAALGSSTLLLALRPTLGAWKHKPTLSAKNDFALFDAVRTIGGSQTVMDASKFYLRMKLLYLHCRKGFKAIHLVRDGRGVVFSNVKRGISVDRAALNWVKANTATMLMFRSMPKESYIRVKYEAFCQNPEAELRRIYSSLNLDHQPQTLDFRKYPHHLLGGNKMRFAREGAIVEHGQWRESMTLAELKRFDRIGGLLNRYLGYA